MSNKMHLTNEFTYIVTLLSLICIFLLIVYKNFYESIRQIKIILQMNLHISLHKSVLFLSFCF
jgi:hypothetical protein